MDIKRNIMKDRNSESPESTLKVKYVVNFGKNISQRKVKLNPVLFKNNRILFPKKIYKISELRKEQFNSYSNENMDFFRLDHVSECDRDSYHNIFMDKLKPINRKENFQKFNEIGKNIKYLDYLKENRLLNQNRKIIRNILSDKEKETFNIRKKYYTKDIKEKIPKENNNFSSISNFNHNLNQDLYDYDRDLFKNKIMNSYKLGKKEQKFIFNNNKLSSKSYNNIRTPFKKYQNFNISNINDYSIKEGDKNIFPEKNNNILYPILQNNCKNDEEIRRLYNIREGLHIKESPFYLAYDDKNKNGGFNKKISDISNFDKINKNQIFFRNSRGNLNNNEYKEMQSCNPNFHKRYFISNNY